MPLYLVSEPASDGGGSMPAGNKICIGCGGRGWKLTGQDRGWAEEEFFTLVRRPCLMCGERHSVVDLAS